MFCIPVLVLRTDLPMRYCISAKKVRIKVWLFLVAVLIETKHKKVILRLSKIKNYKCYVATPYTLNHKNKNLI